MKNFLKLTNFEFNRIFKFLLGMFIFIFVVQTLYIVYEASFYMYHIKQELKLGFTTAEILENYSSFQFMDVILSWAYVGPFVFTMMTIMLYAIIIWYRDWLGKNTFIYRLLMLPSSRINIFFSKLITVKLALLSLIAFQYAMLILQTNIVKWIIPAIYRIDVKPVIVTTSYDLFGLLLPTNFFGFLFTYGIVFGFISIIYLIILLERSFRIIGLVIGILYAVVSYILFFIPEIVQWTFFGNMYLYYGEQIALYVAIFIVVIGISIWWSCYLLKRKVTV